MAKKKRVQEKRPSVSKKTKTKATNGEKEIKEISSISTEEKEKKQKMEYLSEGDLELDIPIVPEAPKKSEKLTLDTMSKDVLERMKKINSKDTKLVLVNCERCKAVIPVPIPKNAVLESKLPVVPISYVHKNLHKEDQHCITIHLDHDFDIRRQRISDVVISSD